MAVQVGNERHEFKKGNKFITTPFNPLFTPFLAPSLGAKANGKGTMTLKGQRPYPEKERPPPVHSFCNTRPNCPYAVPLSSAALR